MINAEEFANRSVRNVSEFKNEPPTYKSVYEKSELKKRKSPPKDPVIDAPPRPTRRVQDMGFGEFLRYMNSR